ncbi:MAG: hypothetical protein ACK4P2_10945 [Hyphomonas sp.]
MTRNDGSRAVYLWRAYLAVMLGTALIAVVAVLVFPVPDSTAESAPPPPFIGFVVLWPAVSSLLLWGVLEVARRLAPTYWYAAGATALIFAGLFTLASGLLGGLIFAWPYFLYALTFLAWHLRSNLEGLFMCFILQVAVNLTLSVLVFDPPGDILVVPVEQETR